MPENLRFCRKNPVNFILRRSKTFTAYASFRPPLAGNARPGGPATVTRPAEGAARICIKIGPENGPCGAMGDMGAPAVD